MTPPPKSSTPALAARMPSPSLLANFRQELSRYAPFAQMDAGAIDFFLTHCQQRYYAPGEVLVQPDDGVVEQIFCIRQGAVSGVRGIAEVSRAAFEYEPGELFPVSAAMAQRAVTATYSAVEDTFVLVLPCAAMRELARSSAPFADFLNRRIAQFLELSRRAVQAAYSSQALAEQSLETPLGDLIKRPPVSCSPATPLREALTQMHDARIGSMLVADPQGRPLGILTRHDLLGRITLPQVPLDAEISQVMVHPVHTLASTDTAQDAALLMSRHGIRHVPVTRDGVAVGLVSERDLFALQRLSLKQVGTSIRAAPDVETLKRMAQDIRDFARGLLSQGVQARQLTALISHLNDVLTHRLLELKSLEHGIALDSVCWLALGSEGRGEQTVATDQDNALILPDDIPPAREQAVRAFAHDVNLALDACGYPLCHGGIMAGEAACCLTLTLWRERFSSWIEQGAPQDLLDASIYFDLRPLAGDKQLAARLQAEVVESARRNPRFLAQLAQNALTRTVPLNWLGGIDVDDHGGVDLKLRGTAVFVDAARIYSLAHGGTLTSTRGRFEFAGAQLGLAPAEYQAWSGAFEFLQMLRLRVQLEGGSATAEPNRIEVSTLNDIDRRILRESLRVGRSLQQRLQMDYDR